MIRNRAANWFPFVMLLLAIAAVAYAGEDEKASPGSRIPVEFIDADGNAMGSAVLTETENGVLVDANLRGLEIGWHGFHIHERAQCKTPDFKSAGGHFAPKNAERVSWWRRGRTPATCRMCSWPRMERRASSTCWRT